jgi:hypothetical protein
MVSEQPDDRARIRLHCIWMHSLCSKQKKDVSKLLMSKVLGCSLMLVSYTKDVHRPIYDSEECPGSTASNMPWSPNRVAVH